MLDVHKVAITSTVALSFIVLTATSLTEISDRGEFNIKLSSCIVSAKQSLKGFCSIFLILELDIYISDHVVSQILTNIALFNFAELGKLFEDLLIEIVELLLQHLLVDRVRISSHSSDLRSWVQPHVLHENGL